MHRTDCPIIADHAPALSASKTYPLALTSSLLRRSHLVCRETGQQSDHGPQEAQAQPTKVLITSWDPHRSYGQKCRCRVDHSRAPSAGLLFSRDPVFAVIQNMICAMQSPRQAVHPSLLLHQGMSAQRAHQQGRIKTWRS